MAWSRGRSIVGSLAALVLLAANVGADPASDRMAELIRRAAQLDAQRHQLNRRGELARAALTAAERIIAAKQAALAKREVAADRVILERTLTAAREQAIVLRGLETESKRLDESRRSLSRERALRYDAEIDRLQDELDHGGAHMDDRVLRQGLARLTELRRAREQVSPSSPVVSRHNVGDLASIKASATDPPEVLLEKADLVDSFARSWRGERQETLRQLTRSRAELDLMHRLLGVMEARRRGRIGSTDPFAADVEAFELEEQEARMVTAITGLERRSKELATWIEQAERRHAELMQATVEVSRP